MTEQTQVSASTGPDYNAIKNKQNAAWSSGDYARIGVTLQMVGESLAEAMDLPYGAPILDVAAGNGNASLAMARRQYNVTSTDYVGDLLERGRQRAEAEGLDLNFQVADAENLPFEPESFDGVVSSFGVMFTPNQVQSAGEMMRVLKPGGRIGMANWTPDSFIGGLFKTLGGYVAPPPGVQSPALWGTEAWLRDTFGPQAMNISLTPKIFQFRYADPAAFVDTFRTIYGPVHKAFLALDEAQQEALAGDIISLIDQHNITKDGSALINSDYVEVIIDKV